MRLIPQAAQISDFEYLRPTVPKSAAESPAQTERENELRLIDALTANVDF
jgi:hypothetical protein